MEPKILYENKDFLIINKPSGWIVHPFKFFDGEKKAETNEPTISEWILKNFKEIENVGDNPSRPGMVHRLDRETSGVMIIAKNQPTFDYLKNLFRERKIKKTYLALVWGEFKNKTGIINTPFGIIHGSVKRSTRSKKMIKDAVTEYEVKSIYRLPVSLDLMTLLEVFPKTGRTHQIRVHLSSIHHPIAGDSLYGTKKQLELAHAWGLNRVFLHADSLEFTAPDGERLKVSADLPEELTSFLRILKS